jgi:hypothetical protein
MITSARCLGLLLSLTLTAPSVAETFHGTFERTLGTTGPVELQVLTRAGNITISNGPAGVVTISARIRVGDKRLSHRLQSKLGELEKNPPIRQTGNSINIGYADVHNVAIDYEISVPVETGGLSADQAREGLHTNLQVHTGAGNIVLRNVKGLLQVESGAGEISVAGVPMGNWELLTHAGDVRLHVMEDAPFDLNASTAAGEVVVDRPITRIVQGMIRENRHSVSGKVAGGGFLLTVHSGAGDIHVN